MKCRAGVIRSKKTGRILHSIGAEFFHDEEKLAWVKSNFTAAQRAKWAPIEECDGNVVMKVEAIDMPEWGGSTATIDISYACTKCTCKHFPGLPDEHNLNEWLATVLASIE